MRYAPARPPRRSSGDIDQGDPEIGSLLPPQFCGNLGDDHRVLRSFAGRIAAAIDPADMLGALLVFGLLLSALVADDALVGFAGARWMRLWHACLNTGLAALIAGAFVRMIRLFLTFPDQQFIADHLPDDLLGLSLGFFPEFAHGGLLSGENGREAAMFPVGQIKDRQFLVGSFLLVTVGDQCNNSVADQN
jgi:hypothetical protein